jgi:hypothetical protein
MTAKPNMPTAVSLDMIPFPEKEARRLMQAARIIERRGHCQHQPEDRQGRVCAMRAYQLANPSDPNSGYGLVAVSVVLDTNLTVPDWNDANRRTGGEVIAAFRRTAHALMKVARGNL